MRLQVVIIGLLISTAFLSLIVQFTYYSENSFGLSQANITNDTTIGKTLNDTDIYGRVRNQTFESGNFGPGQPNAVPIDPSNPTGSLQRSGFTSALKFIGVALTLPNTIIQAWGQQLGLPAIIIDMDVLIIYIIIIMTLASIPFFRAF